jgi:anti-anti-sigma factor
MESDSMGTLVFDLRGLTFIDSTGLRAVLAAHERARSRGGRVVVVRGSTAVDRALSLTELDQRLEVIDDPESVRAPQVSGD